MLNIGKLSPGGGEYYIGEIATSAEGYYTGPGEAAGRWVGTLAAELGLVGEVDPEHLGGCCWARTPSPGRHCCHLTPSVAPRAGPHRSRRVGCWMSRRRPVSWGCRRSMCGTC